MRDSIRDLQDQFDKAELHADVETLDGLLADDFLSIGPKGFVLDKRGWIDRHVHFKYEKLETSEMDIRLYDRIAIVRDIQRNTATMDDQQVELAVRVSQVWVNMGRAVAASRDSVQPSGRIACGSDCLRRSNISQRSPRQRSERRPCGFSAERIWFLRLAKLRARFDPDSVFHVSHDESQHSAG